MGDKRGWHRVFEQPQEVPKRTGNGLNTAIQTQMDPGGDNLKINQAAETKEEE
jgi:hypothetical protein